jgi:hypothetical protein
MGKPANFHESYGRKERIEGPSERSFGFTVGGILAAIGFAIWIFGKLGLATYILWGIGGALMLAALAAPSLLKPLNRAWLKLGLIGFKVINPIVLALIFFVTILPIGLLMRLFGKRPLALRFNREARSYWIKRKPHDPKTESMKHQF